ncbi:MAG TPA: response regulator [Leptolyngbyaceae cyanobacterium]
MKTLGSILVIDDEPNNLRLLTEVLSAQGYLVRPLRDSKLALAAVRAEPPDLILLDIMMPPPDGYEVCAQFKLDEKSRNIPIVFLSALHETFDKVKAFSVGGVDYITKPFQIEETIARIENQLNISRLQKQLEAQNERLKEEIRERQLMEEKLRSSQAEMRGFFEAMADIVLMVDRQGNTIKVAPTNPERLYSYDLDIVGETVKQFFSEDREKFCHYVEEALEKQQVVNYEYSLMVGDRLLWFAASISPTSEDTVAWVARDISDRKAAEQALKISEERFNLAISGTNDGIWDWNVKTDRVYYSPAWMQILGYREGELPQNFSTWPERVHPEDLSALLADLQGHLDGKTAVYQNIHRMKHKDGRWLWVEAKGKCFWDEAGRPYRAIGTLTDITQRKQVEEALRESAEREKALSTVIQKMRQSLDIQTIFDTTTFELRQALKCDRVLVYQFEPDWNGKIVAESVSHQWNSLLQCCQPILTNCPITDGNCALKSLSNPKIFLQDTYLQQTRGGIYNQGIHYLAVSDIYQANFANCYIELLEQLQAKAYIIVPIFCNNQLWGLLATYQNKTSRQWKETEISIVLHIGHQLGIALQQAELLAQTQQQSEALQKAVLAADAANRAKSEFLASMSHELRTPLNAILGFSQMMSRDNSLSDKHQKNLSIINRAGEHLLTLIDDILELSKIEAGRTTFNESSFNLTQMLDNLEKMLQLKAANKGLNLIFEYGSDLPYYVKTDEGKLRQVLLNLLGNAIKFTEQGLVTLRTSLVEDPKEKSTIDEENKLKLHFEIEDTGPGINPAEIHLLFEEFGQTLLGRKTEQGTGLGLPISKKYVQLMGGNITVTSQPGQGSLFAFDIQISLTDPSEIPPERPQRQIIRLARNQPEYRILIVDDVLESRLLLTTLLSSIGFSIGEAENGQEAVKIWENWQPHLVVMDMRMPVMNGYEATKQIRAIENHRRQQGKIFCALQHRTVIIALTASAFEEQKKEFLAVGCDDFIRKPFQAESLLEKFHFFLGVKYEYQSETEQIIEQSKKIETTVSETDLLILLTDMPREWRLEMYNAATTCSDDMVLELIQQIPAEKADLAKTLTHLVDNFQFGVIIKLTQV